MKHKYSYSTEDITHSLGASREFRLNPRFPIKMKNNQNYLSGSFPKQYAKNTHFTQSRGQTQSESNALNSRITSKEILEDMEPWNRFRNNFSNRSPMFNPSTENSICSNNLPATNFSVENSSLKRFGTTGTGIHTSTTGIQVNMFHCKDCRKHIKYGKEFELSKHESDSESNISELSGSSCNCFCFKSSIPTQQKDDGEEGNNIVSHFNEVVRIGDGYNGFEVNSCEVKKKSLEKSSKGDSRTTSPDEKLASLIKGELRSGLVTKQNEEEGSSDHERDIETNINDHKCGIFGGITKLSYSNVNLFLIGAILTLVVMMFVLFKDEHSFIMSAVFYFFPDMKKEKLAVLPIDERYCACALLQTPSLRTMMPPLPGDVQWFPAEIRRLIMAIKKHEGIYNPRHENFGMREFQTKSWKSVASLVGNSKTDTQCRDKWNCLRGTYRRHVRTEATNNVKRRSGWPWAEMMSFIKHYVMEKEDLLDTLTSHNKSKDTVTSQNRSKTPPESQQVKTHISSCPANTTNRVSAVNITSTNTVNGPPALAFTGGIIFNTNRVGIGIVQPNKGSVGVLQPGHNSLCVPMLQNNPNVGVTLVRPTQSTVGMAIVQPTQSAVTMGVVQPTHTNSTTSVKSSQSKNMNTSTVATSSGQTNSSNSDPIKVDLSRVKQDPDSPDKTEFVDIAVKKEPLEEDELQLPEEFNFLPEDDSQESIENEEHSNLMCGSHFSAGITSVRSSPEVNVQQNEFGVDSNNLFMQSTVAHMKQLSPYDQSVFKMKVQQLLHDMMFPQQAQKSA